jgi:hypothetical protein
MKLKREKLGQAFEGLVWGADLILMTRRHLAGKASQKLPSSPVQIRHPRGKKGESIAISAGDGSLRSSLINSV